MVMYRSVMAAVMLVAAAYAVPAGVYGEQSGIDTAVELYSTRHRDPENLDKSETLLKDILKNEPQNVRACYEFSRVSFLKGDVAAKKDDKLAFYNRGAEYAEKATKIDANCVWGYVWHAVNLGRIGQTKGIMNSLFLVDEIRADLKKALAIDPDNAVALEIQGVVNYSVPGLFGGSLSRSIEDLEKAVSVDPCYSLAYIDLSKSYIKKKNFVKARECLNKVLAMEKPTHEADYVLKDKPNAAALLKEIEKK